MPYTSWARLAPLVALAVIIARARPISTAIADMSPIALTSPSFAVPQPPKSPAQADVGIRQLPPPALTTSSSYDYWWPYPPYSASTGTATTDPPLTPASAPSATPISSTSVSVSATEPSSVDQITNSQTVSIIHLTALPPATATAPSALTHKLPPAQAAAGAQPNARTAYYVAPACALLGLAVGAVGAWGVVGCAHRRQAGGGRRRQQKRWGDGELEVGPEYVPAALEDGYEGEDEKDGARNGHGGRYADEAYGDGGEGGVVRRGTKIWLERSATGSSGESCPQGDSGGVEKRRQRDIEAYAWPDTSRPSSPTKKENEREAFLRSNNSVKHAILSPGTEGLLSDAGEELGDWSLVPPESIRHKSIRKGILDRLKNGTMKSIGRRRSRRTKEAEIEDTGEAKSDGIEENEGSTDEKVLESRVLESTKMGSRDIQAEMEDDIATSFKEHTGAFEENDGEITKEGESEVIPTVSGFRIVEAHLAAIAARVKSGDWGLLTKTPSSSENQEHSRTHLEVEAVTGITDDKYTPMPVRKSPSKTRSKTTPSMTTPTKRRSPARTPAQTPTRNPRTLTRKRGDAKMKRVDSSILPASPPLIMSPPLESRLFFTPVPLPTPILNSAQGSQAISSSNANGERTAERSERARRNAEAARTVLLKSSTDMTPKQREKNRLFIRQQANIQDKREAKMRAVEKKKGIDARGRGVAGSEGALGRVEAIVQRGWDARKGAGEQGVASPTLFGALG